MKSRIINGFIEETQLNGIKFTMDDLAKRLGISKRTLYEHFSSKVSILDAIIDMTFEEFYVETTKIIQNENLTLLEKIRQVIIVVPKHNEFYDLRILEQLERYYPTQWTRVNQELYQWDQLQALLEEGIQQGIIVDRNIDLLMKIILEATNVTLDQKFFFEHSISMKDALETIVDMLLMGISQKKIEN